MNGLAASISIILPFELSSVEGLETLLLALVVPGNVTDVVVVGSDDIIPDILHMSELVEESITGSTAIISAVSWSQHFHGRLEGETEEFPTYNSSWTLWLDDEDPFGPLTPHTLDSMLRHASHAYPVGLYGFRILSTAVSCLQPSKDVQVAAFLIPPLLHHDDYTIKVHSTSGINAQTWISFGLDVATETGTRIGGIVVGSDQPATSRCLAVESAVNHLPLSSVPWEGTWLDRLFADFEGIPNRHDLTVPRIEAEDPQELVPPTFILVLSNLDELSSFSHTACRIIASGYTMDIFLNARRSKGIGGSMLHTTQNLFREGNCSLPYFSATSSWIAERRSSEVAILSSSITDPLLDVLQDLKRRGVTVVRLPEADLSYSDWMGTLTVDEWKAWHSPQIDISIVTNNRPHSLARLISSLNSTHYFGDRAHLHVNIEQTADEGTLRLIDGIRWDHGEVSVHHRIVLAGLLPAVVESWYPHSNNTFGLILEDDVELSPMFYAWLKMTLLHYRYGRQENQSPNLFGISLYSQNNIELRPEGRQPFDPRALFSTAHGPLYPANTPYLSQIPCSWGALYFPEHWREFHAYLAVRFSERSLPVDSDVVVNPSVRSNRWTRSWKKYFIELAYLRGYTMLYPNFDNFTSLSTNHLEVGSHVKDLPIDVYEKKKQLFQLPLMEGRGAGGATGLLNLPQQVLPQWFELPVLDLTGHLTSETELLRRGTRRSTSLGGCPLDGTPYDARQLLLCKTWRVP